MNEITIDARKQNCSLFPLHNRQIISAYQYKGEVFALWSRDSSFVIDPSLEQQVLFGVVRFAFDENSGSFKTVHEESLYLHFTDPSCDEIREVTSHLLHDGRIVFAFSEKFTGDVKWGKHNYVIAYNIEKSIWEMGHSRLATGEISFRPWSPQLGSRDELSISYGELYLFHQDGQLIVGIDNTLYHLDDWTRDTDFAIVAPNAESQAESWLRHGSIIVSKDWSGEAPCEPDYGPPIPLIENTTRVKARIPTGVSLLMFENIREVVLRSFNELQLFDDLCYTAQHIHRDEDKKNLPLVHTLPEEDKGVPFTGKLSDFLLSHPVVPEAPPMYLLIPAVRHSDSVFTCNRSGETFAALVLDVLHRTSCVLFISLSELSR